MTIEDAIFSCFNGNVVCLNRLNGRVIWQTKLRKGYMTMLLDGDRLIVSCSGYMYCLDPLSGREIWSNDLPGTGTGVPALVSIRGSSTNIANNAALESEDNANSSSGTSPSSSGFSS